MILSLLIFPLFYESCSLFLILRNLFFYLFSEMLLKVRIFYLDRWLCLVIQLHLHKTSCFCFKTLRKLFLFRYRSFWILFSCCFLPHYTSGFLRDEQIPYLFDICLICFCFVCCFNIRLQLLSSCFPTLRPV